MRPLRAPAWFRLCITVRGRLRGRMLATATPLQAQWCGTRTYILLRFGKPCKYLSTNVSNCRCRR